jgi:hypothetical protein
MSLISAQDIASPTNSQDSYRVMHLEAGARPRRRVAPLLEGQEGAPQGEVR